MSRVNYLFLVFWIAFAFGCFLFWRWASHEISQRHRAPELRPRLELNTKFVRCNTAEKALTDLIYQLGEERRARKIAGAIVRARSIRSTRHLADAVERTALRADQTPAGIHLPTTSLQEMENGTGKPAFRRRSVAAGNRET